MTTVREFLDQVGWVSVPPGSPEVCLTVAKEARGSGPNTLDVSIGGDRLVFEVEGGRGRLAAPHARHLYAFWRWLQEARADALATSIRAPAFDWQRPVFDLYFAQSCRSVRNLDREAYVREMARAGFTHLEVNSLAFPEGREKGVPGEVYPRFYTYCPALDQFAASFLNEGIYPASYLARNLARLSDGAARAERYGLVPTLTCFEPRSVPDALLAKHPELRGCRVDHPFRSFRPRFNLAVSHPTVREHYREMMRNLMHAVPALGCLSVWTNDSGAGFEFTRSLYVGPNGSAYLVREWSEEDVFTKAAADNAIGFLRLLRDAAREVNPDFRVTTRLEPFGPERTRVMAGLGKGLDVEVPTLLATGWESPYRHPTYEDSEIGPFTILNNAFRAEERKEIRRLARRDCRTHVAHAHGPVNNFEPLLGIPSPWLAWEKLRALHRTGARHLAHLGGIAPPASVPFPVNEEVHRRFQHDPKRDVDGVVGEIAADFAGARADALVDAWRLTEEAIRGFDPNPLYFTWGVWYRLQVRPLVPDIEAIPTEERAYYENVMLSTHHNPNRVDLSRDVLFTLMSPARAAKAAARIDRNALPKLDAAIDAADGFDDLRDRLVALRCWMTTRRSVAVWIANVKGYLATKNENRRAGCRRRLAEMVEAEIANARSLLRLWRESDTEFMAISKGSETTFIYDDRFGDHLVRKIDLMERYGDREPRIDDDLMYRVAGLG
ncbi:MAG: hypothetical protein ACYS99_10565 [Planctomycetota bacterium]|jgi:hypothetical protein